MMAMELDEDMTVNSEVEPEALRAGSRTPGLGRGA